MLRCACHGHSKRIASNISTPVGRHIVSASADNAGTPLSVEKLIKSVERDGSTFLKAVKRGDRYPGWKHTDRRSGKPTFQAKIPRSTSWMETFEEMSLKPFFTGHKLEHGTFQEVIEASASLVSLKPGSFIEVRRGEVVKHGIILDRATSSRAFAVITLLSSGEEETVLTGDIMFSIPDFVDADVIKRCGSKMLVYDRHMITARQQVVKRARDFERAVEDVCSGLGRKMGPLYQKVKASDDDHWSQLTTLQATNMVCRSSTEPSITTVFAVHKQLMNRSDEYVAQTSAHRQSHTFYVRPQSHIANMRAVRDFVHKDHNILDNFVRKAQKLIDESRKLELTLVDNSVIERVKAEVKLGTADLEIIKLLQRSLESYRKTQKDPYSIIVPAIVKRLERYGDIDGLGTVVTDLLREIGVHSPWEDLASKDRDFAIMRGSKRAVAEDTKASTINETKVTGLLTVDQHEDVRHDFGNLPVFVIDDIGAEELDDGLSYEVDHQDPSQAWIHIHVADPTSLIPFDHSVAAEARKRMENAYFIHETWPMLPPSIAKSGASLHNSAMGSQSRPQNVLTFSCKLGSDGAILDYKVRPGLIRNVVTLRYDDVDSALGLAGTIPEILRPFEVSTSDKGQIDNTHVQPHLHILRPLWHMSERIVALRRQQPIFSWWQPEVEMAMTTKPPSRPSTQIEPALFRGFPDLTYSVMDKGYLDKGARSLVAECMKLACRIASRFCTDHNIPMFRRASYPLQFSDPSDMDKVLALRDANGSVSPVDLARFVWQTEPASYTLQPAQHWAMGIPEGEGYVRTTSPLRRFQDLVAHWQIKSALLPKSSRKRAPFSEADLNVLMVEVKNNGAIHTRIMRRHRRYWAHLYIDRFMRRLARHHGDDADRPNPLRNIQGHTMRVGVKDLRNMLYRTDVYLPSLGLTGELVTLSRHSYAPGTSIQVNVTGVKLGLFPSLALEIVGNPS